jgi:CheY-like chemotaxis protein
MLTDLMGGELSVSSVPAQGSVFRVRLFLPELHGAALTAADGRPGPDRMSMPYGYAGARRCVMTVDNEEADRGLLLSLLKPLGFDMVEAASGQEALDLLQAGQQPDVILLDLAMPAMDGWETLRRIRDRAGRQPVVAIVSANAFDRALDHDLGISSDDFFVKPVRHSDLLEWLGRRLDLRWLEPPQPVAPPAPVLATEGATPLPGKDLLELVALLQVGYFRGIMNRLDALAAEQPQSAAFVGQLAELARQYRFEAAQDLLQKMLDDSETV